MCELALVRAAGRSVVGLTATGLRLVTFLDALVLDVRAVVRFSALGLRLVTFWLALVLAVLIVLR